MWYTRHQSHQASSAKGSRSMKWLHIDVFKLCSICCILWFSITPLEGESNVGKWISSCFMSSSLSVEFIGSNKGQRSEWESECFLRISCPPGLYLSLSNVVQYPLRLDSFCHKSLLNLSSSSIPCINGGNKTKNPIFGFSPQFSSIVPLGFFLQFSNST